MKWTPGRLRILRLLSAPGAYARPNGLLVRANYDGRFAQLGAEMALLLERRGFIHRARPPRDEQLVYVWQLTEKGREKANESTQPKPGA